MTIDQIIDGVIAREGREYSNRAADRGSATKFGITIDTLSAWRKRMCDEADVMALEESEARLIYRDMYVINPRFHEIQDETTQEFVVDAGVQHGQSQAARFAQQAAGAFVDGRIGDKSLYAINHMAPRALYLRTFAARMRFYGSLIAHDAELQRAKVAGFDRLQAFNAAGWMNRMADLLEDSI